MTEPPEPKPINNTRLHRFLFLALIKLLEHALFLSERICVKYGESMTLSEASTMQFIARNTSIPVPRVICSFTYKGCTYLVMERIRGDMIGQRWSYRTAESKVKILSQLRTSSARCVEYLPQTYKSAILMVEGCTTRESMVHRSLVPSRAFKTSTITCEED
jgi:hypothetical protein